jgi:L-cystine transport system permease protein
VDFGDMFNAVQSGLRHLHITLLLSLFAMAVGMVLGLLIAIIRIFNIRVWARFFSFLIPVAKSIPAILILYLTWFFFADTFNLMAERWGWGIRSKDIDIVWIGVFGMSVMAVAMITETFRGAFLSIGNGQYEAGYSVGLTRVQTMRRIIIPQMLPIAFPLLCTNLIVLIKASSLVYFIGITDVLNGALLSATANYSYLSAYIGAALIYWALSIIIEQAFRLIEKHATRYDQRAL